MSYFISQIQDNHHNQYHYNYLDHLETIIELKENYWTFKMLLFCVNNFHLPLNSLTGNLQLPYQEIDGLVFNLSANQTRAKNAVKNNKNYAKIYECNFNIDISNNHFFKQQLNNNRIHCLLHLEINPDPIKNVLNTLNQNDLDNLINETAEQISNFDFYYSNFFYVNKSGTINNNYGYSLTNGNECLTRYRIIDIQCNNYLTNCNCIYELTTIKSFTPFQVIGAKIKFYYWLENKQKKLFETILNPSNLITNKLVVNFNKNTLFDFKNNEIYFDNKGINGFYLPQYSHGYYELILQINQDSNTNQIIIKNDFIFTKEIPIPNILIRQIKINSLSTFKKIIFND